MAEQGDQPVRCVTVDVEEYFHIEAARGVVPASERERWPSRVEGAMEVLLELFCRHEVRGTLFFLGDVAQRFPDLVKRCAAAGHEIASHGVGHEKLKRLTLHEFAATLRDSKHLLEDLTGRTVRGYRAPTWSVTKRTAWAIEKLVEAGFEYDASIFPVRHWGYGVPDAPVRPFMVRGGVRGEVADDVGATDKRVREFVSDATGTDKLRLSVAPQICDGVGGHGILELPPLTYRVARRNLPAAGGAYLRLLPLGLMKRGLAQAAREGRPGILYFHPWEFDVNQPRMPLSWLGRVRTYTGVARAARRLEKILDLPGTWRPVEEHLDAFRATAEDGEVFVLESKEYVRNNFPGS